MFQCFTKILNNRHLNREGVGLGLTISKNMASALGGDIDVYSELGKGSKFILKLPLNNNIADSKNESESNYSPL